MTDQPYTPTPDDLELFKKIAQLRYSNEHLRPEERQRAFDHFEHMLNAIESAAEQRGAARVLRETADHIAATDHYMIDGDKYTPCSSCKSIHYQYLDYRADRIANKENE